MTQNHVTVRLWEFDSLLGHKKITPTNVGVFVSKSKPIVWLAWENRTAERCFVSWQTASRCPDRFWRRPKSSRGRFFNNSMTIKKSLQNRSDFLSVAGGGVEPPTKGLWVLCSTTELPCHKFFETSNLLRGQDSNLWPAGYGPAELPTALPRDMISHC